MKNRLMQISMVLILSAFVVVSACTANTNNNIEPTQDIGLADCQNVADGDYVPAYDGCNKCLCQGGKAVSCTEKACNPPSALEQ